MGEAAPEGIEVDRVDWLPSGGRSGLIRVHGRWRRPGQLPDLVIATPAGEQRHASLPDPRAGRDSATWRGAYVVEAEVVAAGADRMALVLASGERVPLPPPRSEALDSVRASAQAPPSPADEPPAGGEVVDRAVLAERRARRAEAAEQAQARIAREALRAVEVLELRASELEDRLQALTTERDALAARGQGAEAPSAEAEELRARIAELEAELAALRSRPAAPPPDEAPAEPADADRRVERLRAALSSAIVTIGDLRVALHEARAERRNADVEHGADAVRLAVVLAERDDGKRELADLRARLERAAEREAELRGDLERAVARAVGAEAAQEQTRRQLAERVAELSEARSSIGELEARLAAARAEAERIAGEDLPAAVADAVARREAELRAEHEAAAEAAEAAIVEARSGLERLEARLAEAETARELAEATAAAATAERRAAEVAWATVADELAALRAGEEAPRPDLAAELERERAERRRLERALALAERASTPPDAEAVAEAARSLAPAPPAPGTADRLVADLEAAAAALRRQAAASPEPPSEEAAPEPPREPAAPEPAAPPVPPDAPGSDPLQPGRPRFLPPAPPEIDRPAPFPEEGEDPPGPRIVSPSQPPAQRPSSRTERAYPPLRGALVKLAHDDPAAAAAILAGLLPAQWRVVEEPVDYDLTIAELGTYAVSVRSGDARVEAVEEPRREAEFHLRADALTLAEMLTGFGPRPRRWGRARVSGRRRRLRALQGIAQQRLSLEETVEAGAWIEPSLALRCLAYAVHPSWTRGHDFTVAHTFADDGETVHITARDGRGLAVTTRPPAEPPDATVTITRAAFHAMLAGRAPADRPSVRGDVAAVERLRAWADMARRGTGPRPS